MRKAENKTKKFVLLATYAVAVLCLLAGLFLPLFDGKEILALQLPEAFKSLLNKADPAAKHAFSVPYTIELFGIEKASFDFMALVVVLYAVITALSLLAFVPVILSVLKKGKVAKKFYYAVEVTAVLVLALYFLTALSIDATKCYNMAIAGVGTAVMLLVLCGMDKGRAATVKIGFFLLSLVGFLAMFDFVFLLSKEDAFAKITTKIASGLIGEKVTYEGTEVGLVSLSGVYYLNGLFAYNIKTVLAELPNIKEKALFMLAAITATVVILNFFIDTVKLATGKDKKVGRIFDMSRYGLEFAVAVCTLITALICKNALGLMLIAVLVAVAVALTISVLRFVFGLKKAKKKRAKKSAKADSDEEETYDEVPAEEVPATASTLVDAPVAEDNGETYEEPLNSEEVNFDNVDLTPEEAVPEQVPEEDGYVPEEPVTEEVPLAPPVPDEDGYIDPLLDEQYYAERQQQAANTEATVEPENLEDVMLYQPENDTYLVSETEPIMEKEVEPDDEEPAPVEPIVDEPAEEEVAYEPVPEEPVAYEPAPEEPVAYEPVEEQPVPEEPVAYEPAEEPVAYEPVPEEPVAYEPVEEQPVQEEPTMYKPVTEPVRERYAEPTVAPQPKAAAEEVKAPTQNPFREEVKPYNPY